MDQYQIEFSPRDDLAAGGTLVVPTGSRAAAIEIAWAREQLESGRSAWRTPDVIAYRAWLEREAYRAADAGQAIPRPLRAAEEWLLWREATAAAAQSEGLEAPEGLPDRLHRAARILNDWDISPTALRASARPESRLLAAALAAVEARARDLHAVGTHRLPGLLRAWRPSGAVTFAGFVERSAARSALVRAWSETAGRCREYEPPTAGAEPGEVRTLSAADADDELELAAQWCRSRLSEHPGAHLLVIVPDLAERRAQVLQALRRDLAPRELLSGDAEVPGLLALEGGTPLAGEPIVRHALATLDFLAGRADFEAVSAWLRAAFWNAPTAVERASLDAALRERLGVEVAPGALLAALAGLPRALRESAGRLAVALDAALGALKPDVSAPLGQWARRFERALRVLGWRGDRAPSAREQASAAQFIEALEDLTAIGARMGTVAATEALRTLRGFVERRVLRLRPSDAAVTLCGAIADPIVRYDGIWIAGLTAEAWPAPAEPDPFIPLAAQRRAGVPAANPAARIVQARELLRRCRLAGSRVVASWPMNAEDGERLPSPLLAEWGSSTAVPIASVARAIRASRRIEPFEDECGEPWSAPRPLPSGTRAIEYQSRCAFRAYAELRLACVPLATPQPGVAARDRGRLLHRAVELAWRELGGSEGLEAASRDGTLPQLIETCVERAGDETLPPASDAMARAAQRRERRRAVRLLAELAQLERKRPPFRVRATELRRRIEIEGAALEVRIDRIDELDDGRCALFDYKTGSRATAVDWLEERIGNPQLLVYSFAADHPPAALAMIQLAPRDLAYRGMAERRDLLPKIAAPPAAVQWREQIGRWQEVVAGLVRDFLRGAATVDPLRDACAVCHLHAFCRIAQIAEPGAAAASAPFGPGEPQEPLDAAAGDLGD